MQIQEKVDIVFKDYNFVVNPKHLFIHEARPGFEHNINTQEFLFKLLSTFIQVMIAMIAGNKSVINKTTSRFASNSKSAPLIKLSFCVT